MTVEHVSEDKQTKKFTQKHPRRNICKQCIHYFFTNIENKCKKLDALLNTLYTISSHYCLALNVEKGNTGSFLRIKISKNNVMYKIWYRNPSKSEVIGRCYGDEKTNWPCRTDKYRTLKKQKQNKQKPSYKYI